MSPTDIDMAVDWAAAEGWNPGLSDAGCFAATDPQGFIGGWLGDQMIASISVVNYNPSFAFLGFYIVAPSHRGQGYGYRLWRHAMQHAGQRLVGLDGVPAEQDNYRRSGFELAYRNVRYGGRPVADVGARETRRPDGIDIAPVDRLTPQLAELDRTMFPAARDRFLQSWLAAPGHVSRAAYEDGKFIGYGVSRPCRNGRKIGPLFARDRQIAEALLATVLTGSAGDQGSGEIFLDVPEPNLPAAALACDLGLAPVFETARMYTGAAPEIALDEIFGVTTFELG
jgi:GNAT superfamily N-acetyltransferase